VADNQLRSEEDERAALVGDISYEVRLSLDEGDHGGVFSSLTRLEFDCGREGADTFLNLRAPRVRRVTINDREVDAGVHGFDGARLRLAGLRRGRNHVEVVAECSYSSAGVGLHRFIDPVDGATYVYTHFEPFDAHRVLACFDQPNLKARLTMHVEAPASWTVCGNASAAAVERTNGRAAWSFARTPPLPPYLFAVAAGAYEVIEGPSYREVPLRLMCRRSLVGYLAEQADEILDITRRGLAYFEERYGHRYPFDTYTQVFTPESNMGAMENPGCVTFNEMFIHRGPVSQVQRTRRANVILHEMVHVMGFGDVVTMRDWGDLWLNETFATVEATIAADALAMPGAWIDFAGMVKTRALFQDQLSSTHPILVDAPDTDSIRANFDGITYHKGASVLRQLIAWVGDEQYAAGVRSYFKQFFWSNATRSDFLAHQAQHSRRDVEQWARLWLESAGVNRLVPEVETVDGRYTAVHVRQQADATSRLLRPHHVSVGLYDRDGDRLRRRRSLPLDVTGPLTALTALVGERAADLLVVNDDDLTYAKLRFDSASLAVLLDGGLVRLDDAHTRSLCWTALLDMTRDAELPVSRLAATVAAQCPLEPDQLVLERVLAAAASMADHYTADEHRAGTLSLLADTALDQLARTSPAPLIWARCLATTARQARHLDVIAAVLGGERAVPGLTVDVELRWLLLARLVTHGRAGPAQVDAALELDPTDQGRRRATACLAAQPTASAKAKTWAAAMQDSSLPRATLLAALAGFTTGHFAGGGFHAGGRDQAALTDPYVAPYLEALPRVWKERDYEIARVITDGLFPREPADQHTVAAVEDAIAQPAVPLNCRRSLMEGRDGLVRAAAARAADREAGVWRVDRG
jgi:aminopeptidase N